LTDADIDGDEMKIAVLLGSFVIAAILAGIPVFREGFSTSNLGEWFVNTLFIAAFLSFIGIKFILSEPVRTPSSAKKKKTKKK